MIDKSFGEQCSSAIAPIVFLHDYHGLITARNWWNWTNVIGCRVCRTILLSVRFTRHKMLCCQTEWSSFYMQEGEERDVIERSSSEIFQLKHVSCFLSSVNTKADLKHAAFQTLLDIAYYLYSLQKCTKTTANNLGNWQTSGALTLFTGLF